MIICWHFQSFLGTFGHSRTCLMNDNYPSLLQKKSLINDNYPSMHKNFLDRWECVHEGGGRRQRQKTDAAFRLFAPQSTIHNPQSTANKQQVPNHNAQCPILLRLELGLATCSRLKTLPLFLFLANFYGQLFIFEIQITLKQSFVNICIREQRFSN